MTGVERVLRCFAAGFAIGVLLLAHVLADTREDLDRMRDEVSVVVADCQRRHACTYEGEP